MLFRYQGYMTGERDEAAHRHSVLVVEDDYYTREAFAFVAEASGVETAIASNGREALDKLRSGVRPCIIVLDLAMPVMDGFAFRRVQMADPVLADVPVVVMSGGGWASELEARKLGVTMFLRKPVEPEQLALAVTAGCSVH
jgi:CheY-like chemotaxis protein